MPFNGVGVAAVAGSNATNGAPIDSASYNAMRADANGMWTNCVTRDGQSPWTANIPAGGFRLLNLGAPVVGTDAARLDTVAWELLSNVTVINGVSTVEVPMPTTHTTFELQVMRAAPSVAAVLTVQVSFDNGVTWWSGATAYTQSSISITGAAAFNGAGAVNASAVLFGSSVAAAASNGFASARMTIYPATGTSPSITHFMWHADLVQATGLALPAPHLGSAYTNGTSQQPNRLRVLWGGGATFTTTNRSTRVVLAGIRG